MVEFIKKNKKIILSSSIFTGISSNNIFCGCSGISGKKDDKNKRNNNNNNNNNPKDENPQKNPPTKNETERNNIISECENLIVEIKNLNKDYSKTINKDDTIENLKALKTQLENELNNLQNKKPDVTPEKTEKEKLIEQIINIVNEGINNATEKDKKMLKYLYFNKDIHKTDEELKEKLIENVNKLYSKSVEEITKGLKIYNGYFTIRQYEKKFIEKKMEDFDVEISRLGNDLNFCCLKNKTDKILRKGFFKEEYIGTKDSIEDKIYFNCYTDNNTPPKDFYYCFFNQSIMDKLNETYKENIIKLAEDRFFFLGYIFNEKSYIIHPDRYKYELKIYDDLSCNIEVTYVV